MSYHIHTRKIVRGSLKKRDFSINLPSSIIEKYDLEDSSVVIEERPDGFFVTKMGVQVIDHVKEPTTTQTSTIEDDDNTTTHF